MKFYILQGIAREASVVCTYVPMKTEIGRIVRMWSKLSEKHWELFHSGILPAHADACVSQLVYGIVSKYIVTSIIFLSLFSLATLTYANPERQPSARTFSFTVRSQRIQIVISITGVARKRSGSSGERDSGETIARIRRVSLTTIVNLKLVEFNIIVFLFTIEVNFPLLSPLFY